MDITIYHTKLQKLLILSILICFITLGCKGRMGGTAKPPPRLYKITSQNLHGVDTIGLEHIWAVGAYGSIYHSMDSGKSWTPQASGTEKLLCAVDFLDENIGWAAGVSGTMLHTEDGGKNWVAQNPDTKENLFDLCFVNKDVGWTVGMGTILKTTDGGKTWHNSKQRPHLRLKLQCREKP